MNKFFRKLITAGFVLATSFIGIGPIQAMQGIHNDSTTGTENCILNPHMEIAFQTQDIILVIYSHLEDASSTVKNNFSYVSKLWCSIDRKERVGI